MNLPSFAVCVATARLDAYSETFIRTHIEQLPFNVVTLCGDYLSDSSNGSLLRKSFARRFTDRGLRRLGWFSDDAFIVKRQAEWLRSLKINAVLAEFGPIGVRMAASCRLANVPLVVHFHGCDAHSREITEKHEQEYRWLFDLAAAVVGVSNQMCAHLEMLGARRDRLHYVPYFVDPKKFEPVCPGNAPLTLLAAGRFVEKKAPFLTILAFSKVLQQVPEARLEMAGDGPLLNACVWLARSLGISDRVTFHGVQSHGWVAEQMKHVRGFVQHSVTAKNGDSEGTPVAILESQCSGLPVVATRHAGIKDVVKENETGFLCDEGDYEAMAAHMARVLTMSKENLETMSVSARERIESNFSWNQTLGRLASILESVAEPRHSS